VTEKVQKVIIKLPWEIPTIYSEVEASIERLREADEATRGMTGEEYRYYSDCRHASFTWKKSWSPPLLVEIPN